MPFALPALLFLGVVGPAFLISGCSSSASYTLHHPRPRRDRFDRKVPSCASRGGGLRIAMITASSGSETA